MKKVSAEIEKSQRDILRSGDALADAYSRLAGELSPAVAAQQKFQHAQLVLDESLKKGIVTQQEYNVQLDAARKKFSVAAEAVKPYAERVQALGRQLSDVGGQLTRTVTLPLAAIGGGAVKLASDFESSFAGVRKTVNATEEQFGALSEGMRDLSKEIPVNVNELNRIGEAAGQLGIKTENILGFTEVMAALGVATNLSADEAATALARLANITQLPQDQFDRLGSTIVALGNNFATTEREIVEMGLRIAGAGTQIGLTEGQILAFGTALSSVGIEAEAGGSAISKVMINIALAVSQGGESLKQFADVAALALPAGADFAEVFEEDAAGAVNAFIAGLGKLESAGGDVLSTLEEMGITEVRMRDALLRASGAGDLLTRALDLQAEAWQENNALTKEAEQRYKTFESQLTITLNRLKDAGITLGTALLPAIRDMLDALEPVIGVLGKLAEGFAALPGPIQKVVLALGALAAAAGPVLFITGQLITAWGTLAAAAPRLAAGIRTVTIAAGPIAAIAAGLVALGIAAHQAIERWKTSSEQGMAAIIAANDRAKESVRQLREELAKGILTEETFVSTINESARLGIAIQSVEEKLRSLKAEWDKRTADGGFDAQGKYKSQKQLKEAIAATEGQLGNLKSELAVVDNALARAAVSGLEMKEAVEGAAGPPGGVTKLSEALAEALDNINATIAVNAALLEALQESQEAYEILSTLLEAGVPLSDALTGAYDAQAKKILELEKALEKLLDSRKAQEEIAKSLAETERQIAKDLEAVIAASQSAAGAEFPLFEPPEGITNEYLEILGAVERIRREEEQRSKLLAEIQRQLEAGLITQQEAAKVIEQMGAAQQKVASETEAVMQRAWENIQDTISGAIEEVILTQEISFESLGKSIIKIFAQMLAKLLTMWLANVAARVAAERAGAATSAALSWGSGGGGGGGGWISALGSLFGGGGSSTAATAGTVTQSYDSFAAAQAVQGGNAGWAAGGALGALAIAGVVVAFAAWASSEAAKKAAKRWFDVATVRDGWSAMFGSPEVLQVTTQIRDAIRNIFAVIGGSMESLPDISVQVQATGKKFRSYVDGVLVGMFNSFEEAFRAAALEAVERSDLTRVIPELAAAIAGGNVNSLEELEAVAKVFEKISSVTEPVALQIRQFISELEVMKQTLMDAGVSATALSEYTAAGWAAIRAAITGSTQDATKLFEIQREQFNRAVKEQRAIEEAALAAAEAQVVAAEAEIARTEALIANLQALGALSDMQSRWLSTLLETLGTAQAALAAAAQAAANAQAALDALPELIGPDEFRQGRSGGQRRGDMERLRETLDQMRFDRLLLGMTELEAGLARLDREYQQQLLLAHGNAELIAALNAEYAAQQELLRQQIQLSAVDTFQNFIGIGQDPFSQLRDGWEQARKAVEDAGFGADRAAKMLGRLDRAYEKQIDMLSKAQFVSIGDGLLGILERYYGGVEGFEKFRINLERTRFALEIANLRAQFEILKAQGSLSKAIIRQIQEVFDFIDENPVDWEKFVFPPAPRLDRVSNATSDINSALEEMVRRLKSAKEGITEFLLDLQTGGFGGRSNRQAFEAAEAQFNQIRQQIAAGNIQAFEEFPEISRRFIELARERFGSTARFQEILAQVEALGIEALGTDRITQDNVVFDQRFLDGQAQHIHADLQGHADVAEAVRLGFAQQSQDEERTRIDIIEELRALRDAQDAVNRRLAAIEGRRRTDKGSLAA